jgi:hypothetical protein
MQIVFDIVNPSNIVTNEEIKSTITGVLCHEIFSGRCIPETIHVKLVKHPIRRHTGPRAGELRHVLGSPHRHKLVVHYQGRDKADVLITLFHETCHLMRVFNRENNSDPEQEEQGNVAYMTKINNLVEWISSVLIVFHNGSLGRIGDVYEQS